MISFQAVVPGAA